MQELTVCGDIKAVSLILHAIGYFHRTLQEFLDIIRPFTDKQRERYYRLIIAEYQQFQEISVRRDG